MLTQMHEIGCYMRVAATTTRCMHTEHKEFSAILAPISRAFLINASS
jgi:hypothetical protein